MIYSHSRLSTFEQCPFKFKLRYIDEIKPEIETTIEAHLGSAVHDTLEWVYIQVTQKNTVPTIDAVVTKYSESWQKTFTNNIRIVRRNMTYKDYFNKGIKFLTDYYLKHKPFNDGTLELEKSILIDLDPEGKYKLRGFIDRLVKNTTTGEYEVHDYKTANRLPTQEKMDNDRQLALYSIAIKEHFKTQNNVSLIWHYLAHNTKIVSKRTNEQLQKLKEDTVSLIKQVEATTEFPTYISVLCDWCEYKSMCPAHGGRVNETQSKISQHITEDKKIIQKEIKSGDEKELQEEIKDESESPDGTENLN